MRLGGDFLGAAFYTKQALQASEPGDCFGIMPETFTGKNGAGWKAVEAFGASKKFFEGVVHITPFDGSHKYPVSSLKALLKKNTQRMEVLANKYPNTIWMISLFCEHKHPRSVMEPLYKELKPLAPSCLFVNSILSGGQEVPGMITEIHIESSKTLPKEPSLEYIVSFDGFGGNKKYSGDFPDANIAAILAKYPCARHVRHWNARHNGKYSPTEPNPPAPNSRKIWPDTGYLKQHRATLTPREGKLTWPSNALLKPVADDHGKGDAKDNKLLVILPRGGSSVDVLDSKGTVIAKLSTMGLPPHTGDPKGPRYYSTKYAYQVGNIAIANTGSRQVRIRAGKDVYPLTDVALRSGKFK